MSRTRLLFALATLLLAAPSAFALTAVEVYARVSASVWKVVIFDAGGKPLGLGSAVVVAPQAMVTNCHVVEKAHRVQVRHESTMLDAEVDLADKERDLCRLKVPGLLAASVAIYESSRIQVGQSVYAIGNPRGLELTMSSGLVSAIRRDAGGRIRYIQTSAAISGGSSGGGLFDDEGRLLGLTTSGIVGDAQNLNFAIPADWIKELWRGQMPVAAAVPVAPPAPPPPRPVAPPAPPPAVAVAQPQPPATDPVRPAADLNPGDELEYTITDLFTHATRRVVYRVDRIEGERVIFSDGARVESKSGQLISITSAIGGDMDVMAPPDGWTVRQTPHAAFWALRYSGHHPVHELGYELRAHVVESTVLRTEAGPFEVQHVSYSGWVRLGTSTQRRMKIDVWIAPSLHRVVRFRSEALFSGTYSYLSSNEEAVLSAIRHAGATPASAR